MDELDRRLATIARVAADRADLPEADAVRRRGRTFALRRRAVQGAGALALVVGLAGGYAVATDRSGPAPVPEAVQALAPAVAAEPIRMPPAQVTRGAKGAMELRGPTRDGGTWSYKLHYERGQLCEDSELAPGGAGGGGCGGQSPDPDQLNRAHAGCSGGDMEGDPTPNDGAGAYDGLITGYVSPQAAMVRLDLLDGRKLLVEPVLNEHFDIKLFGAWLPECVSYADTVVLDAAGKVIASRPPLSTELLGAHAQDPLTPGLPGDGRVELRFADDVPSERRTGFLQAIELRGAELFSAEGDNYLLVIQITNHVKGITDRLDQARKAGLLQYELTRPVPSSAPTTP